MIAACGTSTLRGRLSGGGHDPQISNRVLLSLRRDRDANRRGLRRRLPGSDCVVPFDDVIDALQELDEKSDGVDSGGIEGSQPGHRDRHRGGDQEKGRREAEFGTDSYPGRDHLWAS